MKNVYGDVGQRLENNEIALRPTATKRAVLIELLYPSVDEKRINAIEVGLECVRAADNIRVSYDYDRDGWVIQQAARFSWEGDDPACDEDWQEVAFVQAWGRKVPGPGDDDYDGDCGPVSQVKI